jgi:hypothetical protein
LRAFHDSQTASSNPFVRSGKSQLSDIGDASDAAATGLLNFPHHAWESVKDFISSATGQGQVPRTPGPAKLSPTTQADLQPGPIAGKVGEGLSAADTALGDASPVAQDILHNTGRVLGDVGDIAGAVAPVRAVGGAAVDALGAAAARTAAEAASPAGRLGLRTTSTRPIAAGAAGPTAGPTLDMQNQAVAARILGADAGVPHGVPVNHTSLTAAAVKPGELLDQGAGLLPTTSLSPDARAAVQAARGPKTITPGSPDVDNYVNATEAALTDPNAQFSGTQVRATRNLLSGEAAAGRNSADPAQRALAQYKQRIVGALDQHVADAMPPNSAISPEMIANARGTLAKNYNLRELIGKGGDIDLQGLAADHRANPNKFTGATQTVAQFASDHPEVTGSISDATRIAPPSLVGDLSHVNLLNPRTWVQPLVGAAGRAGLRGPAGASLEAATQAPVAGLAGEFDPKPLTALQPPPGRVIEPHQPQLATGNPQRDFFGTGANDFTASPPTGAPPAAAGPPGQIPLADLLSHGVEQPLPQGLSSGPMGSPAQSGIPFARNAEHEAGDLSLADAWASPTDMSLSPAERAAGRERTAAQRTGGDAQSEPEIIPRGAAEREGEVARRNSQEVRTYGGQPANQGLAEVMSSNVPDNIMAKSPPASAPDFENLGQPLVSHEARPDGTHVFSSPNGTTTAVRLPDGSLKITGSTTSKAARGTGEGTARIEAAADFAHKSGDPVVSDNEVSGPEQKVYDSLKRKGLDVRVNPHATDRGTGVKKSASELKGVYEIHPPLGFSLQ